MSLFSITEEIRDVARDAIDSLLAHRNDGGLGQTVRIYYPPKIVPCTDPACSNDPVGAKQGGAHITGGLVPPHLRTRCTLCGGAGTISQEETDEVTMLCNWTLKDFKDLIPDSNL